MKKVSLFLISFTLLWGMVKLLQKPEDDQQVFAQREQDILNQIAAGYKENEIPGFLRASEKGIQ